ncbi:MAG: tetratricopeptide repeat protein [Candidatus Longimicrobiales bacterium M2_2A_002]
MAADPPDLFEELKRRKVFRATAAYLVVAAGVGAVASDFFPALGLPAWTVTLVVALLVLGLPVTIALSWAFDVRPSDSTVEPPAGGSGEPSSVGQRWTAGRIATVAAVAILALAGAAMLLTGNGASDVVENRVAVLPFENGTGDTSLDDLGVVASDWITDGLASVPPVQVIPTSAVEPALASDRGADPIQRVAEATQAGLVVTGSYVLAGDTLEVRAQLVELPGLEVVASVEPGRAHRSRPTAALGTVREQLNGAVASRLDVYGEMGAAGDPPGYDAYRYYLAAKDQFGQGRFSEAIVLFDRATALEPDFLLPRIWVAGTMWQLSDYPRMDSVLRLLEPYRGQASSLERLMMEGAEAWLRGDLAAAYRAGQELFRRYPGSFTRFIAALTAYRYNHVHEAVDLLEAEVGGGPSPDRWIWTHLNLAGALHTIGEYSKELEIAREGRALYGDSPRRILTEARALAALDRPAEAGAVLGELATLSPPGSARWRQIQGGLELRRHGYAKAGEQEIREALHWFLSQQDPQDSLLLRFAIARARLYLGEPGDAARLFRTIAGDYPERLSALGYLGLSLAAAGRAAEAREVVARLEAWTEPYLNGRDLYWRGAIAARLGEEDRAVALLQEAAARGYALSWLHEDENLRPLWDHPSFRQLIEPRG